MQQKDSIIITKGSIITRDTATYVVIGVKYLEVLYIPKFLNDVYLKILSPTMEWFLYAYIGAIVAEYTEDFLDKDIKLACRQLNNGVRVLGKVDEKEFEVWLHKVALQHPEYNLLNIKSIDSVVKEELQNKELYQNIIDFCNIDKNISDEKAKRIDEGKIYYYRVDEYVFYALALGENKFLNLGTDVTRIYYYIQNKDYVTLDGYDLYETGVTCTFYNDLYKEIKEMEEYA